MSGIELGREGRVRDVAVGEHVLLDILRAVFAPDDNLPAVLWVPPCGIPAGAVVMGVHHDFYSRRFYVRVAHESFDPCPEGAPVPELTDWTGSHRPVVVRVGRHEPEADVPVEVVCGNG